MMFGVAEDRDPAVWRRNADLALQFVAGNTVDITDMFRVGRYNPGATRARPIIVKLRTVWDRRILLSNCSKLKQYGEHCSG